MSLLLSATASADSYTEMATECRSSASATRYSMAEYTAAYVEAEQAVARAKARKDTGAVYRTGIAVSRLKQCEKEDRADYPIPPFRDCAQFQIDASKLLFWAAKGRLDKAVWEADIGRAKKAFAPLAEECLREVRKKCVDPNDTKAVIDAIDAVVMASKFVRTPPDPKKAAQKKKPVANDPFGVKLKFCSDTDYACTGDPAFCKNRVALIKRAFESWK